MFRKSSHCTEQDLFCNFLSNMDGTRQKKFNDPTAWHNLFLKYVTIRIDESPFECLYNKNMGSPNAPIRILVGMMILKEGFGWSDRTMFDECDFNIQVMNALGLNNIGDSVPCEATYYNLRSALYEHQVKTGEDLMGGMFRKMTKEQAKLFGVNGTFARMDSKLIGSNICKSSRLQLVIGVLQKFYKDIREREELLTRMDATDRAMLDELIKKSAGQIIYTLDKELRGKKLEQLGYLLSRLVSKYTEDDCECVRLLLRVLSEQYSMEGETVVLKDVKEIKSDSLQSPFDEDAAYRDKNGQKVQGYSANVTETNNEGELKLITDTIVEKANIADNDFFEEAIKRSEDVAGHIGQINTDGAYHSVDNQKFAEENQTRFILSGLSGQEGKYEFVKQEDGQLEVINKTTGEVHKAEEYKEGKYKIREEGKLKYFDIAMITSFFLRQQVDNTPQSIKNMRNNVESAMFQMSCMLRNCKTRYRGKFKNQLWAYCRAMWVNARRITIYIGGVCPDGLPGREIRENLTKRWSY